MTATQHQRNMALLYSSDDDPQIQRDNKEATRRVHAFADAWRDTDTWLSRSKKIAQAVMDFNELKADYLYGTKETIYFWLKDTIEGSETVKARLAQAEDFSRDLILKIQFFELALAKITPDVQAELLQMEDMKPFKHYLARIFATAKHNLSEAEEKIISLLAKPAYMDWVDMREDFMKHEEGVVGGESMPFEQLISHLSDTQKNKRDEAAQVFNAILAKHADVATREVNAVLERKKQTDTLRKFDRADASRHLNTDVESEVIDALLEAVETSNKIAQDYYKLKDKLLGQDQLAYHERNVPLVFSGEEATYSFDQAVQLVDSTLQRLDPEFSKIFHKLLDNGQIDVFPRKGKSGGAFNAGMGKNSINVVMLNHTNKLNDVTTLAHEMGHAINTYLIGQHDVALCYNYGMLTAEVASTFLEDFVYEQLLTDVDETKRLELLMTKLNDGISTIWRQIACYRFEQSLHKAYRAKGFLSRDFIGELFTQHMSAYMGPAVAQSAGSQNRWIYWSHIRKYFYTFSYGGALLLSKLLQQRVRADSAFMQTVKREFYCVGSSQSPKTIFANMGLDIADPRIWQEGISMVRATVSEAQQVATDLGFV